MQWAIGLMSGTSMDGVDAALVRTDGERVETTGPALTLPYAAAFRQSLRQCLGPQPEAPNLLPEVERTLTLHHAEAVRALLARAGLAAEAVGVVGFHGHTVFHAPDQRQTRQIGDGALLAQETGLPVCFDFRSADVAAGGQGAPLVPIYHAALARDLPRPLAVVNIGGVANVTWLPEDPASPHLMAFDTGPGNALVDDWMLRHTGQIMDAGGAVAARGQVDEARLDALMRHPWFAAPPPKSLDRQDFTGLLPLLEGLSLADGAATLTAFTAAALARAAAFFPAPPRRWLVCGGGRHNQALMAALVARLPAAVEPGEAVGWDGDALEAQAFAFLAVRSRRGLPLTFPGTTGVAQPLAGGRLAAVA